MGAFVEITSTFSRTIADNQAMIGLALLLPDSLLRRCSLVRCLQWISPTLQKVTTSSLRRRFLANCNLPFQQDQATGMILEAFPGARTVSSTPAAPPATPPTEPAQPPAARFGTSRTAQPQQASSGPRSALPWWQWEPAPSQAELKRELLEYPDLWYWDQSKGNGSGPDFLSTHYQNDRGYPAGIWIEGNRGLNFTPDELDTLNTMSDMDFCQTKPRTPQARR
jgi:hypothetical protein